MKRIFHLMGFVSAMLLASPAVAQEKILNHVSIGAEVGTTGWGFELASPITHYVTLRTGFTTLPRFSIKTDVNYTTRGMEKNVDIKGRVHMSDYKVLADTYPFTHSSFHLTGGFYAGLSDLGTAHNTSRLEVEEGDGLEIGGVFVHPDAENAVSLRLRTKSFKPYVGLGFGRPISSKHKVGVAFDLGVMFWGKPKVQVYSPDDDAWIRVNKADVEDKDFRDVVDKLEKFTVYPVLNFRIYYNIF